MCSTYKKLIRSRFINNIEYCKFIDSVYKVIEFRKLDKNIYLQKIDNQLRGCTKLDYIAAMFYMWLRRM